MEFRTVGFAVVVGSVLFAQTPPASPGTYTLNQCLEMAQKSNRRRSVSQFAVSMAESQHQQALAGYWPQVAFRGGYQRLDQPVNFLFASGTFPVPAQSIPVPGGTAMVTIPANAFGPGFPPSTIQMPVSFPDQKIQTPASTITTPQQDVKVLDRNLVTGTADMKWLVFDGGMRSGLRTQSGAWLDMMRQESRRTDLEVADSVRRYYWGAVLARQLHGLGKDTLARTEATLKLTETLYKEGSGRVTKADYLDNSVMVETVRAMVAQLEKNEKMAQAALANSMGLAWNQSAAPADEEVPQPPAGPDLDQSVASAYRFNPDWAKLEAALRAAEGAVKTATSEYYPKIALTGELRRYWNGGYSEGLASPQNKAGWSVGFGVEVPIFNGFLTKNKVAEARARLNQLKESQLLLKEGLGLQVKDLALGLEAALKADQATLRAMQAARENLDLNTRAYESGLVETEKVLRSQLFEAMMSAQHFAARYEYAALLSKLNLVVGTEIQRQLTGAGR